MKNFTLLICIFGFLTINAQSHRMAGEVVYDYLLNPSANTRYYSVSSALLFSENESLYEIDHLKVNTNNISENTLEIIGEENEFVYKNLNTQTIYYMDLIDFTYFNIKDSLNTMEWTLNENTKEILGYTCQEATTSYRGRFYIAHYTTEIPVSNGPWHFNGLPGLILEVHSIDKVFNLKATSIAIKNEKIEIKNPFENKKQLSWQGFIDLYIKKNHEVMRNSMTEFGPGQTMPKRRIMEYIKD